MKVKIKDKEHYDIRPDKMFMGKELNVLREWNTDKSRYYDIEYCGRMQTFNVNDCEIVTELTTAEKITILEKAREMLMEGRYAGLRTLITYASDTRYKLQDFPELLKYKPKPTCYGEYWFREYEKQPRLEIIDKALAELKGDPIIETLKKNPDAKVKDLFPQMFEEDRSVDLSDLHNEHTGFIKNIDKLRDILWVRQGHKLSDKCFCLSMEYDWELKKLDGYAGLILTPTKK